MVYEFSPVQQPAVVLLQPTPGVADGLCPPLQLPALLGQLAGVCRLLPLQLLQSRRLLLQRGARQLLPLHVLGAQPVGGAREQLQPLGS